MVSSEHCMSFFSLEGPTKKYACGRPKSPWTFEWWNDWSRTNSGDSGVPQSQTVLALDFSAYAVTTALAQSPPAQSPPPPRRRASPSEQPSFRPAPLPVWHRTPPKARKKKRRVVHVEEPSYDEPQRGDLRERIETVQCKIP
eukprot:COSAG02_NODE_5614_length_4181_cov_11.419157_2_plen_142_part_00